MNAEELAESMESFDKIMEQLKGESIAIDLGVGAAKFHSFTPVKLIAANVIHMAVGHSTGRLIQMACGQQLRGDDDQSFLTYIAADYCGECKQIQYDEAVLLGTVVTEL